MSSELFKLVVGCGVFATPALSDGTCRFTHGGAPSRGPELVGSELIKVFHLFLPLIRPVNSTTGPFACDLAYSISAVQWFQSARVMIPKSTS